MITRVLKMLPMLWCCNIRRRYDSLERRGWFGHFIVFISCDPIIHFL